METIEELLTGWAREVFRETFPDADLRDARLEVVATTEKGFGDYQCNAAMGLARILKQPPRKIAEAVMEAAAPPEAVGTVEIAGPGFLNLHLKDAWLADRLAAMAGDPQRLGVPSVGEGKTVVIDYSAPNVAKQMHIGHIRSTVIGNALDRLHRFAGYRVVADNHVGDWGTQFGILIQGYRNLLDEEALATDPVGELERLYVASYEKGKGDPEWMDACRKELLKLQQGDEENRALWHRFLDLSMGEFERIYQRLGVRFDLMRGESHYKDRIPGLLERMREGGISQPSEGAMVVFLEEEGLPVCIVQKSDGASNYATTDLATVESRVEEFSPARIIYVTDERQQTHFRQIFSIAKRMGAQTHLEHVWFGLMRLPEGTFSTREGNVIKLDLLLDEAEERACRMVEASSPGMHSDQQREVARVVGLGALKYADLSQNPQSVVTFSWDKALSMEGNSAPYLQYAVARIASVRDKYAERFPRGDPEASPFRLDEAVERQLALQIARFPESVLRACEQYRPNMLADYLYELSQVYSRFYQNVPFLKAPEGVRESRIRLCGLTAQVLKTGLGLLGIETMERI
jgi:arginyl-tRNA synthetase